MPCIHGLQSITQTPLGKLMHRVPVAQFGTIKALNYRTVGHGFKKRIVFSAVAPLTVKPVV
jgi:hypothetical protein